MFMFTESEYRGEDHFTFKLSLSDGVNMEEASEYYKQLDAPSRRRYLEKVNLVGSIDPYTLPDESFSMSANCYPSITYPDIVNYLVFGTSPFTSELMKAYKSLEACNQVLEGWVRDVRVKVFGERRLVMGKVYL